MSVTTACGIHVRDGGNLSLGLNDGLSMHPALRPLLLVTHLRATAAAMVHESQKQRLEYLTSAAGR
jgi:hypothetical protein